MSQKVPPDNSQKGFAVGRGLLAAAETLNFSMNEQRSDSLQHGSTSRQLQGHGPGLGSNDGDRDLQQPRHSGSHIGNSMKLFSSLGLSPADLDVLAQIPEDNISVETLPQLIMQLKSRKGEADRRMASAHSSLPPDPAYRGNRDDWDEMRMGRLGSSMGQASARAQPGDLGYSSMQDGPARGYDIDYGHSSSGGGGGRDPGCYSDLSHDRYGGMGMGPSLGGDSLFMNRRMGCPSQGKVQDFLGVMPHMFPHVCSLCDFDVHSTMEWNQHTNGLRHSESRRLLLQMYPEWDPQMSTSRNSDSLLDTSNRSDGLLGPVPMAGGHHSGGGRVNSKWGGGGRPNIGPGTGQKHAIGTTPIRSRVVVAKYDKAPASNKSLFDLAQPFGTLIEHLVLKNKAFLEMETHKEAKDVVSYYQQNPAMLSGKRITFYLSKELLVIEKHRRFDRGNRDPGQLNEPGVASQVVFFSNLPRDNEKKKELLTIAQRFGTVEKHLFLNEEGFIQLESAEDAEMLVKYYTLNPLTISGKKVRLNICVKYKTLSVNNLNRPEERRRRRRRSSSPGPKDKTSSSKSTKSSSSRDEDDRKEKTKEDGDGKDGEGSSDEVAGVMEADEAGEEEQGPSEGADEAGAEEAEDKAVASAETPEENEPGLESDEGASAGVGAVSKDVPEKDREADAEEGTASTAEDVGEGEAQVKRTETDDTTNEPEIDDMPSGEPAESSEMLDEQEECSMEQDFPENMDDFVTLDELADDDDFERQESSGGKDSSGSAKKRGGLRVVNVGGFKRSYGFVKEILALAKPFGTVVQHLVLDLRPEAFLQLSSEEEAKAMVDFYNGNVTPTVCGKPVKIYHSQRYTTIQSGKVVYVGQIPHTTYADASLLKFAEPFGKVKRYFLHRSRNECFIEMENADEAEKMAKTYQENPPKLHGKRLTVYLSRKYKQLKYGHRPPSPDSKGLRSSKRERSEGDTRSQSGAAKQDEEPPVKKSKGTSADDNEKDEGAETPAEDEGEMKGDESTQSNTETSAGQKTDFNTDIKMEDNETSISIVSVRSIEENGQSGSVPATTEGKASSASSLPLEPFDPSNPIGVEFVKMGYYCRVCFLFYSNEETAKKTHCSSKAHYEKLKKHLEKEKAKVQSIAGKNNSV